MTRSGAARLQERMCAALRSRDPAAAFRAIADDPALDASLAAAVRAANARGVAITALIVAKLRFERLMNCSRVAIDWFERDGAAFARAFRAWHESTPPGVVSPAADARSFEAFVAREA